ncbi:MAG: tRNA (N(6)-L-threonylcarbamoyladenosine(37)-C(2))-methylthiotransferase MtaB [Candidatus Magnetomorum sp.]|nr:tRNA (N(6)-L-threonylcarbamoyladenosine(37)-C(2))-methylthiotransferase MtaB [Candidatus Magnetomorum sp.]
MNRNKTYTIQTLGCKVNQYESESIACLLQANGFELNDSGASFAIINTCTVTQKAGMQSRQLIRQTIRNHPDALIFVTGCHAQTNPDDIQTIDGIHYIIGHAYKHEIFEQIIQLHNGFEFPDTPEIRISDILKHTKYEHMPLSHLQHRSRPTIKIQDGCNAFCSYCIVPYSRGPGRSLDEKSVLEQVKCLQSNGYQEVILSGIHLGQYGQDLKPPVQLTDLLREIINIPQCPRIRLSSIEPLEVTEDLIQLIQTKACLCNHLHISLQSGDNETLKRMNRHYTRSFFKELILTIQEQIPDIAIGIDVLVGMPGETQRSFENTLSLLEQLPAAYFHVFPFSLRKGTRAENFQEIVPYQTIKTRAKTIRLLGVQKKIEFFTRNIHAKQSVLIESSEKNYLKGLTGNYIPVKILNTALQKNGQLIPVLLTKVMGPQGMEGRFA